MAVLHVKTPTGVEKAYDLDHIVDIDPIADADIQEKWDNIDPDTSIFTYAPLESPTFTGEPKAPTPNQNDSSTKVATTAFCKELVREHGGMPIGHEYFSINPNIPEGSLPLFGGEYSRETYSDLWAWVQTQTGYCKTEAEWLALSAAHNGNVPFYSDGDGSTTFRVPSLQCWIKGANGDITEVGSYLEAGLPNITGIMNYGAQMRVVQQVEGAFYASEFNQYMAQQATAHTLGLNGIRLDASRSNPIYGNSDTVQPESIVGLWLVRAYGAIVDIGQIDEKQYIDEKFAQSKAYTDSHISVAGCIQAYAGNTLPNGWLLCDGSAVSRTDYVDLFTAIGTLYGEGDGSTTFNLPNLTDRVIWGNATSGTVKSAGLPNITGDVGFTTGQSAGKQYNLWPGITNGAFSPGSTGSYVSNIAVAERATTVQNAHFSAHDSNSIYGNSTTVQPPALTMRYIIKY